MRSRGPSTLTEFSLKGDPTTFLGELVCLERFQISAPVGLDASPTKVDYFQESAFSKLSPCMSDGFLPEHIDLSLRYMSVS